MQDLTHLKLTPPDKEEAPLDSSRIQGYLNQLENWTLEEFNTILRITKIYHFSDFGSALQFANRVGELAEQENHHPCMCIEWGKVTLSWWTHSIEGLHTNDFIMAARCDRLTA